MSRQYENYYTNVFVSVEASNPPAPGPSDTLVKAGDVGALKVSNSNALTTGKIFIGARFQTTLLGNKNLYKKLGFKTTKDLDSSTSGDSSKATRFLLSSQSDGQRLSVYRVYSLNLIPKDNEKRVPPYNKKYPSRVPVAGSVSEQALAKALYDFEFVFKNGSEEFIYVVESGSIMLVRSKKSAARIPKVSSGSNEILEVFPTEISSESDEDVEVLPRES